MNVSERGRKFVETFIIFILVNYERQVRRTEVYPYRMSKFSDSFTLERVLCPEYSRFVFARDTAAKTIFLRRKIFVHLLVGLGRYLFFFLKSKKIVGEQEISLNRNV